MKEWELLNNRKPLRSVVETIIKDWEQILNNSKSIEKDCQHFLKDLPHFFFWKMDENIIINEFYLNTDSLIDLVVATSQYSYGFNYELIELESPNAESFVKRKTEYVPSNELSVALEQINSWNTWIDNNREAVKELFPSKKFNILEKPHFEYFIFIGRRTKNSEILQKINEYKQKGINIHSYDYLTDLVKKRLFWNFYDPMHPFSEATDEELNQFANPYRKAYNFATWKNKIIRSNEFSTAHMICNNIKVLLENQSFSEKFIDFKNKYEKHLNE